MKRSEFEIFNLILNKAVARRLLPSAFCLLLSAFFLAPAAHAGAWAKQKSGTMAWLHAVFFVDARRGWAAGGKGVLLKTSDGGERWEAAPAPTTDALRDIFFTDERTGWLVCDRGIYSLKVGEESRSYLMKTSDGGATWSRVDVTGADAEARLVGVRFADARRGWAFGELGALYMTGDGGATWARQRVPTKRLLLGAAFHDAARGWLVGAGATLLHTEDGGENWREGLALGLDAQPRERLRTVSQAPTHDGRARPPLRFNAVSFAGARRGWAVGAGGAVFATDDGGRTWRAQNSNVEADLFDVKFLDEREGWAVGASGTILRTADGGATWAQEPARTPHTLERLFFTDARRGWAVGFGGTIVAFKG
ncbi:MAG TPA: YCF48-related protein [Pyrinomonadaceae bacterium]|nr:YCF48-related protein [Pyrinomonadaceae bacterium]